MKEVWHTENFVIADARKQDRTVQGKVLGHIGIFREEPDFWTVTHIPSGYAAVRGLSYNEARKFAHLCLEWLPNEGERHELPTFTKTDRYREFCHKAWDWFLANGVPPYTAKWVAEKAAQLGM